MHLETSSWIDVEDAKPTVALLPSEARSNMGHTHPSERT